MTVAKRSLATAALTLSAHGVLVPPAVCAQHGPGRHRPEPSVAYDTKLEVSFTGTVTREIRKGDTAWTLRDEAGQALWAPDETKPRGFWTGKKVLLTVVALKVVALATVLRH